MRDLMMGLWVQTLPVLGLCKKETKRRNYSSVPILTPASIITNNGCSATPKHKHGELAEAQGSIYILHGPTNSLNPLLTTTPKLGGKSKRAVSVVRWSDDLHFQFNMVHVWMAIENILPFWEGHISKINFFFFLGRPYKNTESKDFQLRLQNYRV